jgi:dihydroxyacetone kinase-like predicted kinase
MAGWQNAFVIATQRIGWGKLKTWLNCVQINLQHYRLATDNLRKIIEDEGTDRLCIQEPHTIGNKLVGLPRSYKVLAAGEGRKRAAIVINNKNVDTILINQLSDEDAVVMETKVDVTLIIASMYFDINRPIDTDLKKMEATITHAKGVGIIFVIDSNSRSNSWHDVLTNKTGKIMEEFLLSRQLHIVNEDSRCTMF